MAGPENNIDFDQVFEEISSDFDNPVASLVFDINAHLLDLRALRPTGHYHEFHTLPTQSGQGRQDVLLVDRYHPKHGAYTRVLSTDRLKTDRGLHFESGDYHLSPGDAGFWYAEGTMLVTPTAKHWPMGKKSAPVIRPATGGIVVVNGPDYDPFPNLPPISDDQNTLAKLTTVLMTLEKLGPVSYEPSYELGAGVF